MEPLSAYSYLFIVVSLSAFLHLSAILTYRYFLKKLYSAIFCPAQFVFCYFLWFSSKHYSSAKLYWSNKGIS